MAIDKEMDALIKQHVFGPFKQAEKGNNYTDSRFTFIKK